MFLPGEEEETEDIRDNEQIEDKSPLSTSCKGSRQEWTNGCSNAEMVGLMTKVTCFTIVTRVERLYRNVSSKESLPAGAVNNCSDRSKCFA